MSDTFTAQELADFYQKVADGGVTQYRVHGTTNEWRGNNLGPCFTSITDAWRIKPTEQVIDPKLVDVRAAHEAAMAIALAKFAEECDAAFIDSLLATAKEQD